MSTLRTVDTWHRRLLVLAVPATALFTVPSGMDPTGLPKLVAGLVVALLLTVLTAGRWFAARRIALPAGPAAWAAAGFAGAVLVATAVGGFEGTAVLGQYGRYSGFLLYMSAVIIFLHVLAIADDRTLWRVAAAIAVTGAVVTAIGLLQGAGVSVLGLRPLSSPLIGTFGNPNFFAAFLGIVAPFAALWLVPQRVPTVARIGSSVLLVGALAVAAWSRSFQGVLGAAVALAVFGLFVLHGRAGRPHRLARGGLIGATLGGLGLVALGAAGTGPVASVVGSRAIEFRLWYWQAAMRMLNDHPIMGVGMDQYSIYFRRYRSFEAFQAAGVGDATDAAHNVPLSMFANGGLLLGGAYLVVLAVVLWAAVSGFCRVDGSSRPLLGAFVGAWLAYQVQSLVSIDVPPLAYVNWMLAGGIFVLAPPWRTSVMAGDAPGMKRSKTKARSRSVRHVVPWPGVAVLAGVTLVALWAVSLPLRADAAAGAGQRLAAVGQTGPAIESLERAVELAPWQSTYHAALGETLLRAGDVEEGLQAFTEALAVEPADFPYTVTLARLSAAADDPSRAKELYEHALTLEPNSAEIAAEAAQFYVTDIGDESRARELLDHALALSPEHERAKALAESLDG